ncbi:hypothetical protein ACXU4B_03900 [Dyella soli]|uniref:3-hydroxyacyl-CoA dehydrogenase n=1 Tax=Dyella soli TaxID=522319 RepID=A0A4R0YN37_9GAMM|nr:3-hydroxyacyl-CoA dehydrogenase [Dyella soli]TCI10176.1 3-hydroxyacyl-CoA dehydrogenase [Dyella soli]
MSNSLLVLHAVSAHMLSAPVRGRLLDALFDKQGGTPEGIAIDYVNSHVYWTNTGADWSKNDGFIERADFDGANRKVIVPKGATYTPKQMQLDVDAGLIYWCDREGMRVMRSRLDGSDVTVLVQTGVTQSDRADERNHCAGIALDRHGGQIFWTQMGPAKGGRGRIFSAPMDLPKGMNPARRTDLRVLLDNLPEPIDLEWDVASNALYWTDRGSMSQGSTLNRCRFTNGIPGKIETLLSDLQEGIDLALDTAHDEVILSDLGGILRTAVLSGTSQPRIIRPGIPMSSLS